MMLGMLSYLQEEGWLDNHIDRNQVVPEARFQ